VSTVLAIPVAVAMLVLPSVARADGGNWFAFGVLVLVIPTLLALGVACALVWILCPLYARPMIIALCAIPCTPLDNGRFYWPLWSYFLDNDFPGTMSEIILRTSAMALAGFVAGWFAVWLQLRASAHNTSLERTRGR